MLKNQIHIFFAALGFYTRIRTPRWVSYSQEIMQGTPVYLPLIGYIVGAVAALVVYLCHFVLPMPVSIVLSMISTILLTGAFHEDGFADVCDGFGGGWNKKRIMEIMKDSCIGAYGVVGLISILLLKFLLLSSIDISIIPFVMISAHAMSRFAAISLMYSYDYARQEQVNKAGVVVSRLGLPAVTVAGVIAILPLAIFNNSYIFALVLPIWITRVLLGRYFFKWIGGFTGDCLGAVQQVSEIIFYLSFIILWRFIS